MKKNFFFALAAAFAFVACQQDPEVTKDDEPNQNQNENQNQGNEQTGDDLIATLCINEVCGVVGSKGIELYNPTAAEISLEGVTIYKNEAADPTWTGDADAKIASKGYYVITSKKEFDNIADVANAKAATASPPPSPSSWSSRTRVETPLIPLTAAGQRTPTRKLPFLLLKVLSPAQQTPRRNGRSWKLPWARLTMAQHLWVTAQS